MRPILVTGATGNVGSEVVRILKTRGVPMRLAVTRLPPPKNANQDNGNQIQHTRFDFQDPQTFPEALEGVDKVFLVRPPHLADAQKDFQPFLTAAKASGVSQVVFLSLLGADKNTFMPHAKIEKVILGLGLPYTFLRAGFFMQNLSTTHAPEINEWNDVFVPAGHGKTGFIDVQDIAEVAALALTEPGHVGKAYALTGREAISYGNVAAILSKVLGRPITYSNPWLFSFYRRMSSREFATGHILVMCAIYTVAKLGMAGTLTDDIKVLLGRDPISFEQFAERNKAVWQPK